MLQEILKEATKPHHDRLEQLMFVNQIMDGTLTAAQYQKLLVTNYLCHAYFEGYIFSHLTPALRDEVQLADRIKLPALKKDMGELGLPIPEMIINEKVTPIEADDASLMGALYVMEGATLGGNVIVKRLLLNPELQQLNLTYNYYQAYGPDLINKWKLFVQVLNTRIATEDYGKATKAAADMFVNMQLFAEQAGL